MLRILVIISILSILAIVNACDTRSYDRTGFVTLESKGGFINVITVTFGGSSEFNNTIVSYYIYSQHEFVGSGAWNSTDFPCGNNVTHEHIPDVDGKINIQVLPSTATYSVNIGYTNYMSQDQKNRIIGAVASCLVVTILFGVTLVMIVKWKSRGGVHNDTETDPEAAAGGM